MLNALKMTLKAFTRKEQPIPAEKKQSHKFANTENNVDEAILKLSSIIDWRAVIHKADARPHPTRAPKRRNEDSSATAPTKTKTRRLAQNDPLGPFVHVQIPSRSH